MAANIEEIEEVESYNEKCRLKIGQLEKVIESEIDTIQIEFYNNLIKGYKQYITKGELWLKENSESLTHSVTA